MKKRNQNKYMLGNFIGSLPVNYENISHKLTTIFRGPIVIQTWDSIADVLQHEISNSLILSNYYEDDPSEE